MELTIVFVVSIIVVAVWKLRAGTGRSPLDVILSERLHACNELEPPQEAAPEPESLVDFVFDAAQLRKSKGSDGVGWIFQEKNVCIDFYFADDNGKPDATAIAYATEFAAEMQARYQAALAKLEATAEFTRKGPWYVTFVDFQREHPETCRMHLNHWDDQYINVLWWIDVKGTEILDSGHEFW